MKLLTPQHWKDYELLDSGNFEKLERFGNVTLRRPEPQAVWGPSRPEKEWKKLADLRFVQDSSASGNWEKRNSDIPDRWYINYKNGKLSLRFRLALTRFKHVGIFPEQAVNWDYIFRACSKIPNARVLNLFAYTGGASLAARAGGANVIHCDSIRQVVNWANENMTESKLKNIRWLVEDAFKFVKREAQRGNTYNGIILDPPAWGHGPKGEKWKLEEQINEMIANVSKIIDPKKGFMIFNAYSLGYSPLILENLVRMNFEENIIKQTEIGELYHADEFGKKLPAGVFARFMNI